MSIVPSFDCNISVTAHTSVSVTEKFLLLELLDVPVELISVLAPILIFG